MKTHHAFTLFPFADPTADGNHRAGQLVSEDLRRLDVAMENLLDVRAADPAGGNFDERFAIPDRKSTRLNSSHGYISYAVFCLKKKKKRLELLVLPMLRTNTVTSLRTRTSDEFLVCCRRPCCVANMFLPSAYRASACGYMCART